MNKLNKAMDKENDITNFPKPKLVSFRKEISDITNSKYLTHSLYYHPAKFIPQIVRYCLDNYCRNEGKVLDPFAGSGTVALESSIRGSDSYMLDINPLLEYFYPVKMPMFTLERWNTFFNEANRFLAEVLNNVPDDIIEINGELEYWYPKELYNYFKMVWSNYHSLKARENDITKKIVILILFRLSKLYSYAEHSMPKLFISPRKREFINNFINENHNENNRNEIIERKAFSFLDDINNSVVELLQTKELSGKIDYFSGIDSYKFDFSKLPKLDCIITSPPYLQAQEYIRTFKMEMRWSGISNELIKELSGKEIPFRKPDGIIKGDYIDAIRSKLKRNDLIKMFDSYFWFTIKTLEKASERLKKGGKICILIGNPKMEGIEVEIWKVIYEYFVKKLNYKPIEVFEDKIVSRKLFKGRNNLNPDGMLSEYLVVLEK
jgi:DNA modification methylase